MMSNTFMSSVSLKFHLNTENKEKYKGHWIRNHVKKTLSLFLHRSLTKGNTKEKKRHSEAKHAGRADSMLVKLGF